MENSSNSLTENDLLHLKYCLTLAEEALEASNEPFGSTLVNKENQVIAEARNRVNDHNVLAHPELKLAFWASRNLSIEQRKETTMYTSGEHCPMCAAAHGWVGIGRLVYLSSGAQLNSWLEEFGAAPSPIQFIPVQEIIKKIEVRGPATGELLDKIKALHQRYHEQNN